MAFEEKFVAWLRSDNLQVRPFGLLLDEYKKEIDAELVLNELIDKFLGSTTHVYNEDSKKVNEEEYRLVKIFFDCFLILLPLLSQQFPDTNPHELLRAKLVNKLKFNSGPAVVDVLLVIRQLSIEIDVLFKKEKLEKTIPRSASARGPETLKVLSKQRRFSMKVTMFGNVDKKNDVRKQVTDFHKQHKKHLARLVETHGHAFWVAIRMVLNSHVFQKIFGTDEIDKTKAQQKHLAFLFAFEPFRDIRFNRYQANPLPLVEAKVWLHRLTRDKKYLDQAKKDWDAVLKQLDDDVDRDSEYFKFVEAFQKDTQEFERRQREQARQELFTFAEVDPVPAEYLEPGVGVKLPEYEEIDEEGGESAADNTPLDDGQYLKIVGSTYDDCFEYDLVEGAPIAGDDSEGEYDDVVGAKANESEGEYDLVDDTPTDINNSQGEYDRVDDTLRPSLSGLASSNA